MKALSYPEICWNRWQSEEEEQREGSLYLIPRLPRERGGRVKRRNRERVFLYNFIDWLVKELWEWGCGKERGLSRLAGSRGRRVKSKWEKALLYLIQKFVEVGGKERRRNRERIYFILSTDWLVRDRWESEEKKPRKGLLYPIHRLVGER
jgi:hypothetical protein